MDAARCMCLFDIYLKQTYRIIYKVFDSVQGEKLLTWYYKVAIIPEELGGDKIIVILRIAKLGFRKMLQNQERETKLEQSYFCKELCFHSRGLIY